MNKLVGEKVWAKVTAKDATTNADVTGWINLAYVKMGAKGWEITNPPAATLFKATTKMALYMYEETDTSKPGDSFTASTELNITEVKKANGEFWGKVYHEANVGWVQLKNTTFTVDGTILATDPDVVTLHDGNENDSQIAVVLANGTAVKITALKVENGEGWAQVTAETATGWVKLANLTSVLG